MSGIKRKIGRVFLKENSSYRYFHLTITLFMIRFAATYINEFPLLIAEISYHLLQNQHFKSLELFFRFESL